MELPNQPEDHPPAFSLPHGLSHPLNILQLTPKDAAEEPNRAEPLEPWAGAISGPELGPVPVAQSAIWKSESPEFCVLLLHQAANTTNVANFDWIATFSSETNHHAQGLPPHATINDAEQLHTALTHVVKLQLRMVGTFAYTRGNRIGCQFSRPFQSPTLFI